MFSAAMSLRFVFLPIIRSKKRFASVERRRTSAYSLSSAEKTRSLRLSTVSCARAPLAASPRASASGVAIFCASRVKVTPPSVDASVTRPPSSMVSARGAIRSASAKSSRLYRSAISPSVVTFTLL